MCRIVPGIVINIISFISHTLTHRVFVVTPVSQMRKQTLRSMNLSKII